jgi:hypothetical protein
VASVLSILTITELGQFFARYVSDSLSVRDQVGNDDILYVVAVEELLEFLDGHGTSPLPRTKSYVDPSPVEVACVPMCFGI